jgi:hypothetical protein
MLVKKIKKSLFFLNYYSIINTKPYKYAKTSLRICKKVIEKTLATLDCLGANYSVLFCFAALVEEVVV